MLIRRPWAAPQVSVFGSRTIGRCVWPQVQPKVRFGNGRILLLPSGLETNWRPNPWPHQFGRKERQIELLNSYLPVYSNIKFACKWAGYLALKVATLVVGRKMTENHWTLQCDVNHWNEWNEWKCVTYLAKESSGQWLADAAWMPMNRKLNICPERWLHLARSRSTWSKFCRSGKYIRPAHFTFCTRSTS